MGSIHSKFESRFLVSRFFVECRNGAHGSWSKGLLREASLDCFNCCGRRELPAYVNSISICTSALYILGSAMPRNHMTSSNRNMTEQPQDIVTSLSFLKLHAVLSLSQDLASWKCINSKAGPHCIDWSPSWMKASCLLRPCRLVGLSSSEFTFSLILLISCTRAWALSMSLTFLSHTYILLGSGSCWYLSEGEK